MVPLDQLDQLVQLDQLDQLVQLDQNAVFNKVTLAIIG